jgi:hypothetical protein
MIVTNDKRKNCIDRYEFVTCHLEFFATIRIVTALRDEVILGSGSIICGHYIIDSIDAQFGIQE